MLCPHCQTALVMSERQGVEIDYCPQCRGVWLDRGELDKIMERSTRDLAEPARVWAPPAPPPPSQPPQYAHQDDRWVHNQHKPKRKKSFLEDVFDF
ncbi:MAG: zf-TFIIB domain-containing protein [Rhodospirillaceae bacterium]|nr:zf-TFIIB domain-containing protein [Rhodospirillales bacterium]